MELERRKALDNVIKGFFLAWITFESSLHIRENQQLFVKTLRFLTFSKALELKPSIGIAVVLRFVPPLTQISLKSVTAVCYHVTIINPHDLRPLCELLSKLTTDEKRSILVSRNKRE